MATSGSLRQVDVPRWRNHKKRFIMARKLLLIVTSEKQGSLVDSFLLGPHLGGANISLLLKNTNQSAFLMPKGIAYNRS